MFLVVTIAQMVLGVSAGFTVMGPPQFESEWLTLTAQSPNSDLQVDHGLGVVPSLVEVLVKSVDSPNSGFIFKAMGNAARDDDYRDIYGGVIYIYDDVIVRVMAPRAVNSQRPIGGTIYTGEPPYWRGVNIQHSFTAEIKVRCWSALPSPCFNVAGILMVAGSANVADTYQEFQHNMGQYPDLVKVRALMTDGPDTGWYTDAQGSSLMNYNKTTVKRRTGGLKFAYNKNKIRVWTSSTPFYGEIFSRNDGWGSGTFLVGAATSGYVEVTAWCGLDVLHDVSSPIGPDVSDGLLELSIPKSLLYDIDYFVSVSIKAEEGPNQGYRFEGAGGATTNTYNVGPTCAYGGLIFAYNSSSLRFWVPAHSTGAAICIPESMGHGTNSQASQAGQVVVRIFLTIQFGITEEYQPAKLVCSHFTLLSNNSGYRASPIEVQYVTSTRACNTACQQHEDCFVYAFSNTECGMYSINDMSFLYHKLHSHVWGLKSRTVRDYCP